MENIMETQTKTMTAKKTFPKICFLGYARSGKDTLAEFLRDEYGLKFISSSQAAADIFIYDALKDRFGYKTPTECFEDRVHPEKRKIWYDMICDYNREDKARLAREVLKHSECYVGMRDKAEIDACKKDVFDIVIWVDASERIPAESTDSCTVTKKDAHIIIENNTTKEEFFEKARKLANILMR